MDEIKKEEFNLESPSHFVGIGASAGGLEALQVFFRHLPSNTGASFIIVQHLSPDYKSMMPELLSKHTSMSIHLVEDGIALEPDSIYLMPPRKNMLLGEGKLFLSEQMPEANVHMPIDTFLRTLAEDQQHKGIGIVLSGTGSDGTRGIKAIKEAGGLVIVQEPSTAKFDGMPISALKTGLADILLAPKDMGVTLAKFIEHPSISGKDSSIKYSVGLEDDTFSEIFQLLKNESSINFSQYKASTVARRIERRLGINQLTSLESYLKLLLDSPKELQTLSKELLIGVTRFFRDDEAFSKLTTTVVPAIVEKAHKYEEEIRIWVAGCSTGEEAYSIAILFDEYMQKKDMVCPVKIFATDVDKEAISEASYGIYSIDILQDLTEERLSHYFELRKDKYVVSSRIRQMVIFASHNMIEDPPFSNLDLVTCRNVLIYFQHSAQKRVLASLHFALNKEGYLLLGASETLGDLATHFYKVDERAKVFLKISNLKVPFATAPGQSDSEVARLAAPGLGMSTTANITKKITQISRGPMEAVLERLVSEYSPNCIVINQEVGTEGQLGGKAEVRGVSGAWQELTDNVNGMADNLTNQVRNIATVATAVANGDLSQKITVDARGEILELKNTINTMVDKLTRFAAEVTRVAQEVGTEGKLGGQAEVSGVTGAWGDLTFNVNKLANNLTDQVRDIARVAQAVANGNLEQKITVEAQGEVLALKETINSMTETLSLFANQVTSVAKEVGTEGKLGGQADVPNAEGIWKDLTENVNELADNLTRQIRAILTVVTDVTEGNLTGSIDVVAKGEVETLKNGLNQMIKTLKDTSDINFEQDWLKTNLSNFSQLMQGNKDLQSLADVVIQELCPAIEAQHGVFYLLDEGSEDRPKTPELVLLASYAYHERKSVANAFELGQGLVGQAGREKKRILVHQAPDDYIKIGSGLGDALPLHIVVIPVLFEGELLAVIELASFNHFTDNELNFLDQLAASLGVVANAVKASAQTERLLQASQSLSQELQDQQAELTETNQKLEVQAKNLRESESKLKSQQEELQQTNEELEEKSRVLADQKREVEQKNREVEIAKVEIEEKAQQLAVSSRYKSEFLANMSHELRTPLNSLMVLSDGLRKNIDKNLTDKQIEKMSTIHDSGIELLELINEILDLAKIEAGKMSVQIGDIFLQRLTNWAERGFSQLAENKGLKFLTSIDENLPAAIQTDEKRLQQVIKNFLSNAIKFTEKGKVSLDIYQASHGWSSSNQSLNQANIVIAFAVQDTGIGIPEDKHQVIFEAFQQADGTTSRRFGGTGLGLSISREIAGIMGGEITLQSTVNEGSVFTLFLPQVFPNPTQKEPEPIRSTPTPLPSSSISAAIQNADPATPSYLLQNERTAVIEAPTSSEMEDDRVNIKAGDRTVLIIEDDLTFAKVLLDRAREQGFKGIVATQGDTGLYCAQEYRPDAIILDIRLPVMNGWTVLDRIKHDANIRHIPVHVVSADDVAYRGLKHGAISCLQKPLDEDHLVSMFNSISVFNQEKVRHLLVIEDDESQRKAIADLIGNGDVHTSTAATALEGLELLEKQTFHCLVLDLMLPDMSGFELIEKIKQNENLLNLPIIVYTGKELTEHEETRLRSVAETIIVKNVRSPERLLDETALFLHRVEANLPESKRQMLQQVHESDPQLAGRKILIVDDDVRNIFTLTSVFEAHESVTVYAESGKEAIEILEKTPDIEIVLMDIMMPEMDGYETMRRIRQKPEFVDLPIIAVTAKAMREDRQKCLDGGASDYLVKPIDTEQLLSLVRVWLYREPGLN